MTRGIIYFAYKCRYLKECHVSISTVRRLTDLPITVFTPTPDKFPQIDGVDISQANHRGLYAQTYACANSPYDETLYLDVDTIIIDNEAFLPFEMLQNFDVAAVHAPFKGYVKMPELPDCFPQFNCGVIFFNSKVQPTMERWFEYQHGKDRNQPSFASLMYASSCRIATLPTEWNYRGFKHQFIENFKQVHIAHNRRFHRFVKPDGSVRHKAIMRHWAKVQRGYLLKQ